MMYICAWQAPALPPDAFISSRITLAAVIERPAPPISSSSPVIEKSSSGSVALEQASRDDQLLDLVRAFPDQEERRVAVVALRPVIKRVAVAAVDAHAVERVLLRRLGGEVLRHPRLEVGAVAARLRLRRMQDEEPRCLGARRHLRDHQLHRLVFCNRLAEGFALAGVADGVVERGPSEAGSARRDVDAADLDPAHEVP